jgi:polysaccharide export outer membrane protein
MTGTLSCCRFRPSSRRRRGAGTPVPRRTAWTGLLTAFVLSFAILLIAPRLGVSPVAAATSAIQVHPEYTLGSGDVVKVTVFGQDDLSGEFTVDGQGMVSLPLVGNVKIGGLNVRQAEKKVVGTLKPDYLRNPRVSIEVLNYRPFYIIGEVKKPGSYPYVSGMTVINAVALGGGFTYRARENDLLIIRATDPGRHKQRANQDTVVLPGDVVEVPERYF